jgi:hypothetical protein
MKAAYEQHWHEVAPEVLLEMNTWPEEHPTATMQEIEEEVDTRMAQMRARLVEGLAMSSAAAEVGSRASDQPACCPTCGGVLQAGAQADGDGGANSAVRAQLWLLPHVPGRLFPPWMSNWDCGLRWGSRQRWKKGWPVWGPGCLFGQHSATWRFSWGSKWRKRACGGSPSRRELPQMQGQAAEGEALLRERSDGPAVQLLSLDGALSRPA